MKTAVFPGSFDPVTLGHLSLIGSASRLFDRLIIAVEVNSSKKTMFSAQDRVEMLKRSVAGFENVSVMSFDGFTSDFCEACGAGYIVRGIRNASDGEYEKMLSSVYRFASPEIETVCLFTPPELAFLSSTVAREFIKYGKSCESIMPDAAIAYIKEKK